MTQDGKTVTVQFTLKDPVNSLVRYNLFVNDVPLFSAYGRPLSDGPHETRLDERVELTKGNNKSEVACLNDWAVGSLRVLTFADYKVPVTGDLYYLGFGVSAYKDHTLDLAALLASLEGRGYGRIHTRTNLNEAAPAATSVPAGDWHAAPSTPPHNKGVKRGRAGTTVAFFSAVGARHAVPSRTPACGRSR
ncbi:MAG: hypothetical protein ABIF71_08525 [Planctomycetota bacterium]